MPRLSTQRVPVQTELWWVTEDPEGVEYASPGTAVINVYTGAWFRKTTPIEVNTGWVSFGGGSSGGVIVRDAPSLVEPPPSDLNSYAILRFRNGAAGLTWDVDNQLWF